MKYEEIQIWNYDGIRTLEYLVNTSIVDYPWDLCNNSGDIEIIYKYNGETLGENGLINVTEGDSYVNVTTNARAFSCPQNMTSEILISN